jgi:nitrite reductase/ring-hydroxylating ferredoxin subunit
MMDACSARGTRRCTTSAPAMVRGPQGAFKPMAGAVKATTGARSLKTFPVEVRDGAIWLVG